jgi:catechol 2,3-dioxygenase-like lactoylglutathione lyase family enzyme
MEPIIAQLLEAFEAGKLSRRQLIQGLATAATGAGALFAAAPLAAAPPPTPKRAPFRTAGLDHISYAVTDYQRSRDFYADLLGWEVTDDNGESQATLGIGDVGTIIIRNSREPSRIEREGRPPLTGVINHVAWRIEDFDTDEVRGELERRGLNPRRDQGGGDGYDSYHVLDPDGWDLQISG